VTAPTDIMIHVDQTNLNTQINLKMEVLDQSMLDQPTDVPNQFVKLVPHNVSLVLLMTSVLNVTVLEKTYQTVTAQIIITLTKTEIAKNVIILVILVQTEILAPLVLPIHSDLKNKIVNVWMDIMIMVKLFVPNVLTFVLPVPLMKHVLNVLAQELCQNVIVQMVNGITTELVNLVIICVKPVDQAPLIVSLVPITESTHQHVAAQTIIMMTTPMETVQNVAVNVLLAQKMDVLLVLD
jgi:hypothetical protein